MNEMKQDDSKNVRKLTEAEEKRKKKYEITREKMIAAGYKERDLTISVVYANVMAFVISIPFFIVFLILFYVTGGSFSYDREIIDYFIFVFAFFAGAVIHELIHGAFWGIFAENHLKAIEFGFIKEYLTPYCACSSPLKKYQYVIGAIMPTVILGVIPCIISLWNGQSLLLYFGLTMIMCGGGDMTIILKIIMNKSDKKEIVYLDHPYECGSIIFER